MPRHSKKLQNERGELLRLTGFCRRSEVADDTRQWTELGGSSAQISISVGVHGEHVLCESARRNSDEAAVCAAASTWRIIRSDPKCSTGSASLTESTEPHLALPIRLSKTAEKDIDLDVPHMPELSKMLEERGVQADRHRMAHGVGSA